MRTSHSIQVQEAQIEIPLSKKKILFTLVGAIGFVAIGFWFVLNPQEISNPFFGNKTIGQILKLSMFSSS